MNSHILIVCVALIAGIIGCKDRSTESTAAAKGEVALYFGKAPSSIARINARLTRSGFSDITPQLTIADSVNAASGLLHDVAVGTWHLEVGALDSLGHVAYSGETEVDVLAGQLTEVSLELSATTGDVVMMLTWGGSCVPPVRGLISFWAADGNGNDRAGHNDGRLMDSVTFAQGKVGRSFAFDGVKSFVHVPDSPNLNPTGSFTIEAWVYPTADVSSILIAKWRDDMGAVDQRSWQVGILRGRSIRFAISDSAHQHDGPFHVFDSKSGAIDLNVWSHLACVYNQASGKRIIYVNGEKIAERTDAPISIMKSVSEVTIGTIRAPDSDHNYSFFHGRIDEMSFYNVALSGAEIRSIYAAGSSGKCRETGGGK